MERNYNPFHQPSTGQALSPCAESNPSKFDFLRPSFSPSVTPCLKAKSLRPQPFRRFLRRWMGGASAQSIPRHLGCVYKGLENGSHGTHGSLASFLLHLGTPRTFPRGTAAMPACICGRAFIQTGKNNFLVLDWFRCMSLARAFEIRARYYLLCSPACVAVWCFFLGVVEGRALLCCLGKVEELGGCFFCRRDIFLSCISRAFSASLSRSLGCWDTYLTLLVFFLGSWDLVILFRFLNCTAELVRLNFRI